MNNVDDVTAFVLAGGKSIRMGKDKAFLEFKGRILLARALESIRLQPEAARERAAAARTRLESAYAVEPWLDRYEAVYRDLARGTATRSPRP